MAVGKFVIIYTSNVLVPVQSQAIICTYYVLLQNGHQGTNIKESK